jgi:uncharacterized protein YcbK (DUF882 family)
LRLDNGREAGLRKRLSVLIAFGCAVALARPAAADAPTADPGHSAAPQKKKRRHAHARGPVYSGRLASQGELRDEPLDKPSGRISLYAVNFREELDVNIYNEDGSFNEEALDELNHLWRCKRTDTEKAINPRLFEMLSRIYDRYGRRIELVSGFRNQKRTSSFHFHGSASDIRIAGISDKELYKFAASLDVGGMGLGIYPRAGFIHVDIRPEPSFRWVDNSPPGSSEMGRSHKKPKAPNS